MSRRIVAASVLGLALAALGVSEVKGSSLEANYIAKRICKITVPGPSGGDDFMGGPPASISGRYDIFHVLLSEEKPSEIQDTDEHTTQVTAVFVPKEDGRKPDKKDLKIEVFTGQATFNQPLTDEGGRPSQIIDLDLDQCYAKQGHALQVTDEQILFQGSGKNFAGHGEPFREVHGEDEAWTECKYVLEWTKDEKIAEKLKEHRVSLPGGCPFEQPPACGGRDECRVFITSARFTGDLVAEAEARANADPSDGLAAGDALCQFYATTAGLDGIFQAWLADPSGSPMTRFTQASIPYRVIGGDEIAGDWKELTDGSIAAPIRNNEFGTVGPSCNADGCQIWSAVDVTGGGYVTGGATCSSWTNSGGRVGLVQFTGVQEWGGAQTTLRCDGFPPTPLLCVEQ